MYLDETGFEKSVQRTHGWAEKGRRVYGLRSGQRRPRTSLIGAQHNNRLLAPMLFEGTCNRTVFNLWLKNSLLPALPKNSVVILDNATFHTAQETQDLLRSAGHEPLYLPPYSPDLNPIEKRWGFLKRKRQYYPDIKLDDLIKMSC